MAPWGVGDRRRRGRRPYEPERQETPTYLVERDAPPWTFPLAPAAHWVRRAVERVTRDRVDAYPDHARPFEGRAVAEAAQDVPDVDDAAVRARLPKPGVPKVRLMVVSGRKAKVIRLMGWSLERFDFSRRSMQAWLVGEIEHAVRELEEENKGQGLTEYALILVLVLIVAIIAVIFLGERIFGMLSTVGSCIPAGC